MPDILVYMKSTCPYSRDAMALLKEKGAAFEAVDVAENPERRPEMEQRSGRKTTPQIFIGGRHIGGCDDLLDLDASGQLNSLLDGHGNAAQP